MGECKGTWRRGEWSGVKEEGGKVREGGGEGRGVEGEGGKVGGGGN